MPIKITHQYREAMVVEQKDKRDAEARDTQVGSLFKKMQTNTLHFVGATSASACGNVMNSAEVDKSRQTRYSAIKQIFFSTYECVLKLRTVVQIWHCELSSAPVSLGLWFVYFCSRVYIKKLLQVTCGKAECLQCCH